MTYVDAAATPPIATSCLEDWIRLPADDADLRARLASLSHHAAHHPTRPELNEHGMLTHRGVVVRLSPVEQRLARPLIADFGEAVSEADMLGAGCLDGCNEQNLRVHVSRLRRRVAPIGLCITRIRGYGYVLSPGQDDTQLESSLGGRRARRIANDADPHSQIGRENDRLLAW